MDYLLLAERRRCHALHIVQHLDCGTAIVTQLMSCLLCKQVLQDTTLALSSSQSHGRFVVCCASQVFEGSMLISILCHNAIVKQLWLMCYLLCIQVFEGAIVAITHNKAFAESLLATHVLRVEVSSVRFAALWAVNLQLGWTHCMYHMNSQCLA